MRRDLTWILTLLLGLALAGCSTGRRGGGGGGGDDDDSADDDDASDDDDSGDDDDASDDDDAADDDDAVDPEGDQDGDGLDNAFEQKVGTDLYDDDTDGDGYSDAFEVLAYFDPNDSSDVPYEGGWPRGPLPSDSEWSSLSSNAGWGQGDFSDDWSLVDQHGDEVHLKDFYGQVVLLEFGAEWCGPCRAAADAAQWEFEERVDDGFVNLHLLLDGYSPQDGNPDVDRWISDFDLDLPVFDDGNMSTVIHYIDTSGSFGIPLFAVIDRYHEVAVWNYQGSPAPWNDVDSLLSSSGPSVDWPLPDNASSLRSQLGFGSSEWNGYKNAL